MAEGDGLENRYIRKGIKGSNPLLSAKYLFYLQFCRQSLSVAITFGVGWW